jgi:SPX domain protein involved in polyphosphate accumulation
VSDYCLVPNEQFFSYLMARTNYFDEMKSAWYYTNNELDFYSDSSLKQRSAVSNVAPLQHNIPILSQPVFALTL